MVNNLFYISIGIIICLIIYYNILVIIFKIKSRFWYIQPCYHFYDLHYICYNNQVINPDLPKINSFVSFEKVVTYSPDDIQQEQFDYIIELLKKEYYHTNNAVYNPTIQSVVPYLSNNYYTSYISLAVTPTYKFIGQSDNNSSIANHIIKYNDIIGCIMSKAVCITIPTGEFYSYYVDFFCIKNEYRKLGYAEIMIQSHEYSNRMKTKDIQVHLFKREGDITGIVPVVKYDTYLFKLNKYCVSSPSRFLYNIKNIYHTQSPILLEITKLNIHLIYDYLSGIKKDIIFQFTATVHISNFKELIETKNIYCFVLMYNQRIYASYFLRNTFMEIDNDGISHPCLSCFASIKDNEYDLITEYSFPQTFHQVIQIIQSDKVKFSHLFIEHISHNYLLINDCEYISKTKTAYFLYNYILQPLKQKNVFIII
jgi:hypothetical protein